MNPNEITRFWINSLGEFGHNVSSDPGNLGLAHGSIDMTTLHVGPTQTLDMALKQAFDRELHANTKDYREVALYRSWEKFDTDDGPFRFNASLEWSEGRIVPTSARIDMTQEYVLNDDEFTAFEEVFQQFIEAGNLAGFVDSLWEDHEDSTKTQYAFGFNVFGMTPSTVLAIQIAWEDVTQALMNDMQKPTETALTVVKA